MNLRVLTSLLIFVYGLSITGSGVMEAGHQLTHAFKNKVHHHEASHHHVLQDHGTALHDSPANDDDVISSLSCSFLFYEFYAIILTNLLDEIQYRILNDRELTTIESRPFIPPPIGTLV